MQSRVEALVGHQSPFARTPKYRVVNKKDRAIAAKKYRKRLGWYLGSSCWSAATSLWPSGTPVTRENYFTVPFLVIFVLDYWYTGLMSLLQGRSTAWFATAARSSAKPFPVGV